MDLSTRTGRREQGLKIQGAVERAGLSIEELAGRIGCSRALIYQYLSGSTLAQPDRLQQIAAECGVTLEHFYAAAVEAPEAEREPGAQAAERLAESLQYLQDLANAQESPADYRALAATCERILSLAEQAGDRALQARAQKRLGVAWLRMADFPRAVDALKRAAALSADIGDSATETGARQSLGNGLLAMGRYREAREQFETNVGGTIFSGRWQGLLSLGAVHELHGEYREAMERFDEAAGLLEDAAQERGGATPEISTGMLYVNANRTNVYLDGGDFGGAMELAERCMSAAEAMGNADQHLEARFNLGWCHYYTGKWERAYFDFTGVLQLARFLGDRGRQTLAQAWISQLLAAAGDFESAAEAGKTALAAAHTTGDRRGKLYAQSALADVYNAQEGRQGEALYHAGQALAVAIALRQERHEAECRIRLARASSVEPAEMRDSAERALSLAIRLGARHLECLAQCQLASALCAAGNEFAGSARDHAEAALVTAEQIGLSEGVWRANDLLARIALADGAAAAGAATEFSQRAVDQLETLRRELTRAGLQDTLLENRDCLEVYARHAEGISLAADPGRLEAFLDNAGWPPLTAMFGGTRGTAQ